MTEETPDRFESVNYSEHEMSDEDHTFLTLMSGGHPGILLTARPASDGISDLRLEIEVVGGLPTDLIEPLLEKALTALRQAHETKEDDNG